MSSRNLDRLTEGFSFLGRLTPDEHQRFLSVAHFPTLEPGDVAYSLESPCPNYLMCIEGRTRIFKTSEAGREMLLYNVEDGGTCVLTTQCLLSRTNFPAESVAERRTLLAAIPASWFYTFVAEIPAFRRLRAFRLYQASRHHVLVRRRPRLSDNRAAAGRAGPGRGRRDAHRREDAPAAGVGYRQRPRDREPPHG